MKRFNLSSIKALASVLFILIIITSISIIYTTNHKDVSSNTNISVANTINEDENQSKQLKRDISIRLESEPRQYKNIMTTQFKGYFLDTSESCKLTDGKLSLKEVSSILEEYINNNKFEVKSIGMVNDGFFIQQDTSVIIEDTQKVNILSLKDDFTFDDFSLMTEAVYSSTNTKSDSLFTYETENGSKHYIYVYTEQEKSNINEE